MISDFKIETLAQSQKFNDVEAHGEMIKKQKVIVVYVSLPSARPCQQLKTNNIADHCTRFVYYAFPAPINVFTE